MPAPWSETSMTVERSLRRTLTCVRPPPWAREFSMRVATTCVSGPTLPQTAAVRGTWMVSSRCAARKAGDHSSLCWVSTWRSSTTPGVRRWEERGALMRSWTTEVRRSICSSEMRASSRTHSSELVARISSSRIDRAVSGVRS